MDMVIYIMKSLSLICYGLCPLVVQRATWHIQLDRQVACPKIETKRMIGPERDSEKRKARSKNQKHMGNSLIISLAALHEPAASTIHVSSEYEPLFEGHHRRDTCIVRADTTPPHSSIVGGVGVDAART